MGELNFLAKEMLNSFNSLAFSKFILLGNMYLIDPTC